MRRVNAELGPKSKIHVLVLLWNGNVYSSEEMNNVLASWKGPNKNELVISIGLDHSRKIVWSQCYSWVDDTTIHSKIRQDILAMDTLNFDVLKESIMQNVPKYWVKKDFKDFDYIKNPLPTWAYITSAILQILACSGAIIWMKFYGVEL